MVVSYVDGLPFEIIENQHFFKCGNCKRKFFTHAGIKRHARTTCNKNKTDKRQIDWVGINNDN